MMLIVVYCHICQFNEFQRKRKRWVECSLFRSLLVWIINKVFLSIKPDAEEEPEGGGGDPKTITNRIAKKKEEKLERNNSIKNQSYSFMMIVCSLCNCESRRNCSPRGSGGPFSRCISRTQNSDGTWALSKLKCTTPILIESIIFWRCPLNNSCWEDLIDVALTNGYSQVIDIVDTVYIGIKENLNNNLKTLFTCLVWCKGTSRNIWQHSEHFSAWSCSQADLPRRRARPSIPPRTEQCAVSPPIKQLDPLSST